MAIQSKQTMDFVRLLTSHQSALRALILSIMPGQPGVCDVLQEVNIHLWKRMDEFTPGSNFRAWAFSVARFKVMEHLRQLKRDKSFLFDDELAAQLASDEEVHSEGSDRLVGALEHCIKTLRPKDQELLHNRYATDTNLKSYAEQTRQSEGGLRVTLHRLRSVLRDCIQKRLNREEFA